MASITWAGTSGSVLDEDHPSNGQANSGESIERGLKDIKADEVIASRTGDVLGRHTMLKADHFPSELLVAYIVRLALLVMAHSLVLS